jgi:hypothetical protein
MVNSKLGLNTYETKVMASRQIKILSAFVNEQIYMIYFQYYRFDRHPTAIVNAFPPLSKCEQITMTAKWFILDVKRKLNTATKPGSSFILINYKKLSSLKLVCYGQPSPKNSKYQGILSSP